MKNAHSLLFHGYSFPLEDRPFLKAIAYDHMGDKAGQKFLAEWRETLRILSSHPGFSATYGVHVLPNENGGLLPEVHEHVALLGDEAMPFATLHMTTQGIGDHAYYHSVSYAIQELEAVLKAMNSAVFEGEYQLGTGQNGERRTLQFATLFYELRRTLLAHSHAVKVTWTPGVNGTIDLFVEPSLRDICPRSGVVFTFVLPEEFNRAVRQMSEAAA
ncbi:hypothetical protein AWB81_01851 [Caballeronia arationis]|uniref:hypothetical protein n=1 Tax=Caballeronia arationis TaxID=1777142 RepID=UPI00074C057D|nr:hypothetical protein [Caballeronia arationis]SAK59473.1 hypothetical protein AWB81_01851 [Caballeronia arationis]